MVISRALPPNTGTRISKANLHNFLNISNMPDAVGHINKARIKELMIEFVEDPTTQSPTVGNIYSETSWREREITSR